MSDAALPPPLVPAEVDLRDFAFMPLDVVRVRDSDLAAEESPESCWAALLLWCASWHQVPAGSIPDSDQWQAKQAGYVARGRIDKTWDGVRDGALRNWIKCSDGRLYHPVVAEKALESWDAKLAQRARTRKATEAREKARREAEEARRGQRHEQRDDERDVQRHEQRDVARDVHQGTGTVKGQGQGHLIPPPDGGDGGAALSATPPAPPPPPDFDGKNADELNGKSVVCLSAAFELPEQWGIDAEALGWKPGEVLREAERFRQYWTRGKGQGTRRSVKGWSQTWSNWLAKAAGDRR